MTVWNEHMNMSVNLWTYAFEQKQIYLEYKIFLAYPHAT
jgi:hypothetical protein